MNNNCVQQRPEIEEEIPFSSGNENCRENNTSCYKAFSSKKPPSEKFHN